MKRRLYWAAALLCPILLGFTPYRCPGEVSLSAGLGAVSQTLPATPTSASAAPVAPTLQTTALPPPVLINGLRYFRFRAGRCDPGVASPPAATAPTTSLRDERRAAALTAFSDDALATGRQVGVNCRRGVVNIKQSAALQVERLRAFSAWCRDTAAGIANVCGILADSYRKLRAVSACFSSDRAQAQPATLTATGAAPTDAVALPGRERVIWMNARGDCIISPDRRFNPNPKGETDWRRVERPAW